LRIGGVSGFGPIRFAEHGSFAAGSKLFVRALGKLVYAHWITSGGKK
jgi:hypothetical protein